MSTPGRVRPSRRQTRQQVLGAAFVEFAERGIAATSVSQIAEAAGMTKGAVYSSFTGKDDLVLALLEEYAAAQLSSVVERLAAGPARDVPGSVLRRVADVLVAALRIDVVWYRLLTEYFALSQADPARRERLRGYRREARREVADLVARVAAEQHLTLPMPPAELTLVLFALSTGLALEAGIDPDAVADDLVLRVLALLTSSGGTGPRPRRTPR